MPVPDYQSLMLPTLKALSDGAETSISELRARIAAAGGLTQEDVSEKLPSGRQTVFANRVGWALLGLDRAGLVQRVRRAVYRLTAEGGRLLAREPARVDDDVLRTYPAFVEWKDRERTHPSNIERPQPRDDESKETPEETLDRAAGELRAMLEAEVLDRVRNAAPVFLERVVSRRSSAPAPSPLPLSAPYPSVLGKTSRPPAIARLSAGDESRNLSTETG